MQIMSDAEPKSSDQILEELFKSLASQPENEQGTSDKKIVPPDDGVKNDGQETKSKVKKGKKKKKKRASSDSDGEERSRKRKKRDKNKKTNENDDGIKEKKKKDKKREKSASKEEKTDKSRKQSKPVDTSKKEDPKSKERRSVDKEKERHEERKDRRRSPEERPSARERDRHDDRSALRERRDKRSDSRRRRSRSRSPLDRRRVRRSRSPPPNRRRRSRSLSQRRRRSRSPSNHRRPGGDRSRSPSNHRRPAGDRSSSPSNHRRPVGDRSKSPVAQTASVRNRSPHIDKAQLLQAARENLKRMKESGSLPGNLSALVVDGPRASTKPTGKTVEEFTDYCKNLIRQGSEESEDSASKGQTEPSADSTDASSTFKRHPFQIKPRNDTAIVMNIRNAIPIPVRKPEERVTAQAQLKQQFPVSSGQQHLELEWVPVSPKPTETTAKAKKSVAASEGTKTVNVAPVIRQPAVPAAPDSTTFDIGEIVSRRLAAIRKLQENKEDDQARIELEQSEMMSKSWASQTPQQRTNPITGEPLPELVDWSGAPQSWARKDQFTSAAPVFGGVGMKLLQKMGWQPGEGLGRNKEGTLEPLALDIKTDKKGLVSREEVAPKSNANTVKLMQEFQGKHPVSILHELCTKRRWEPPMFEQVLDVGPDHQKHFLFKVNVNGVEYRPCVASTTKKEAKAQSAAVCLQSLSNIS